jgi:hypothetical protein
MRVADFEGTYAAGEASMAVGGGPGVIAMRNQSNIVWLFNWNPSSKV